MSSSEKNSMFLEEKMLENCPRCPLCGSEKGFKFSGWGVTYAECKNCGATWLLNSDNMKLVKESKDGEGFRLVNKAFPYDFWQKLSTTRPEETPEAKETAPEELKAPKKAAEEAVEKYELEKASARDTVLYVFIAAFLILMSAFGTLSFFVYSSLDILEFQTILLFSILFADLIVIGVCSILVVNWAVRDEIEIRNLKNQIRKLRRKIIKKE
ncbi:MAG: hypothetical protein ACQXXH_02800 [Candidatus Bathyarchaeia archaeon]|jgi:hypothetical protein|nr:hypothetical protein [Candidatus Bathyarchaeota archaeon A05DMB-4]MDH7594672.1 hypothetical protein [Candidatus Bathyarchaeota archaeon]